MQYSFLLYPAKFFIFILCLLPLSVFSQQKSLGIFDAQTDLGKVKIPGSGSFQAATQQYTLQGSGENMWFKNDEGHFMYKKIKGDFILRARVAFVDEGVEEHRKIGWIIRSSLDSGSAQVSAVAHGNGLISLQYRRAPGMNTEEKQSIVKAADVLQLERRGNRFIMSVAHFGDTLQTEEVDSINLGNEVYAGIFICSHNNNVTEKATFHNVRIIVPAKNNFVPYHDYIGSNIEIMEVQNGWRQILYHSSKSLQAPNWMKDGKSLIYNSEGIMYKFNLASRIPQAINTGNVKNNNNDHIISFNGKMLGLSSSVKSDHNNSNVFTVSINGGEPKRITKQGPSYLHGWSPDGKDLVFTGQRNGDFDIYKILSDGGKEIRLTTAKGLDDGPEYSPDGKYIYFCSVRSGMMQVWRMKPDGSDQQQLTNDDYNNWFPHVSPDGKWIVFISFPKEVAPDDHPFYKHVYLRLMPANGGAAKVVAYIYGGQGTINTPSWSPDSRHIAFVSNSDEMR